MGQEINLIVTPRTRRPVSLWLSATRRWPSLLRQAHLSAPLGFDRASPVRHGWRKIRITLRIWVCGSKRV